MTSKDIIFQRLLRQGITGPGFSDAGAVVGWMGCMQAQDYAQAKWAIGLRAAGVTEAQIEKEIDAGRILRTHILRPTWHWVLPADIGWMLTLTGPRVRAFAQPMVRKLGIGKDELVRSKKILVKALSAGGAAREAGAGGELAGGGALTRVELAELFRRGKINTDDIRMNYLMMDAELEGLICNGPRRGKQFTYALLEERVQGAARFEGDAAIGELARRYILSRGPATVQDFAWWSGFSLAMAGRGIELVRGLLEKVVVGGRDYWFCGEQDGQAGAITGRGHAGVKSRGRASGVLLLPAFDEYTVGYADRSDVLAEEYKKLSFHGLRPAIVINGKIVGLWRRVLGKGKVVVEVSLFEKVSSANRALIGKEAKRFGSFTGNKVVEVVL